MASCSSENDKLGLCGSLVSPGVEVNRTDLIPKLSHTLNFDPRTGFTILFKSEESVDDPWLQALNKARFPSEIVPTIDFEYFNQEELWNCLTQFNVYQGMIISSPRVVDAINQVLYLWECEGHLWKNYADSWKDKAFFCVGPKTEERILCLFKDNGIEPSQVKTYIAKDGNMNSLNDEIVSVMKNNPGPFKLLMPCGTKSGDDINSLLTHNVDFTRLFVYRTIENSDLEPKIRKFEAKMHEVWKKKPETPFIFMFFSPSGVQAVSDLIKSVRENPNVHIFAIGKKTATEISNFNGPLGKEALALHYPKPTALIDILEKMAQKIMISLNS